MSSVFQLQGFGGTIQSALSIIYYDTESAWLPWEFLPVSMGSTYYVGANSMFDRVMQFSMPWRTVIMNPKAQDWSILLGTIKKAEAPAFLVISPDIQVNNSLLTHFVALKKENVTICVLKKLQDGVQDIDLAVADVLIFPALQQITIPTLMPYFTQLFLRIPNLKNQDMKQLFIQLAAPKLAMLVSKIDETEPTPYWYKPVDSIREGVKLADHVSWLEAIAKGLRS